jgi:hypothetical protein
MKLIGYRESILVILQLLSRRACILPLNLLSQTKLSRGLELLNFEPKLTIPRIFTGDVVEGAVWLVTGKSLTVYTCCFLISFPDTEVTNDLNDAYSRMKSLGQTYAVVGNHDSSPVNSFPPGAVDTTITTQWAYDTMSSDWSSWIGATAAAQANSNYGSYSVLTSEGNYPVLLL